MDRGRRRDARSAPRTSIPCGAAHPTTGDTASRPWRRWRRPFPGVLLNLDIKGTAPYVAPYEELLADELAALRTAPTAVIVASFHDDAIARFRALAPEVATSAATDETAAFFFSSPIEVPVVPPVRAFQVPARYGELDVVTESFVEAAHAAGVAVHVWTINDVAEMARLLDLGVDGVVSGSSDGAVRHCWPDAGLAWDGKLDGKP